MDNELRVSAAYPAGQWAKALRATEDADPVVRARAAERVRRWEQVIQGMTDGTVTVGDRAPVTGLPAWVTPQVVHGGFATGRAMAETAPDIAERLTAKRAGVPATRVALFGYHLTEPGLAELRALIESGDYRLEAPEGAALPVVDWLLEHGHTQAAARLVDEIMPFAPRLRFTPKPQRVVTQIDPALVYQKTAAEVGEALARRRPNLRVEAMREALTVWHPFGDELLAWWLDSDEVKERGGSTRPGEPSEDTAGEAWLERGRELAARYRTLAREHTLCGKHRNPKENLGLLVACLETVVAGENLGARRRGLLRMAVEAMVARRGAPGEARHTALRAQQAAQAARPTHREITSVVIDRLDALPGDVGIPDIDAATGPVDGDEHAAHPAVPAGTPIPAAVVRVVRRAKAGRVEELVGLGLISSAEQLARLIPQLTARTFAAAFRDPHLSALMAALYQAFRARRSVLLLNLQHQVRISELPWVAALADVRTGTARDEAAATLRELGALALSGFPGTQLPNRLVTELRSLADGAGLAVPWVEELAADIFMGTFTPKFLAAAKLAAGLLAGSVYEHYYGIDYAGILAIDEPETISSRNVRRSGNGRLPDEFAALCLARAERAGRTEIHSVAGNGMVIEQAQILTTHNLAALAGPCAVRPNEGWQELADRAFAHMIRLADRLSRTRSPLPVIKDLAYAWRQTLFYLSMPGTDPHAFCADARLHLRGAKPAIVGMLTPVIEGLDAITAGASFDADGRAGDGWVLLGWSTGGHWLRSRRD